MDINKRHVLQSNPCTSASIKDFFFFFHMNDKKDFIWIEFIQNLDTFSIISRVLCFPGKKKKKKEGLNSESKKSSGNCTLYFNKILERMDKLVGTDEHRCTETDSLYLLGTWYQYHNESSHVVNTEL